MAGASLGVVVAFSAGLFSFLSPCVLPLFPSYLSFITGMSVGDLSGDLTAAARRRVLLHSVTFVLGFSLVFVALGASFSAAGQALFQYRDWIRIVGGVMIVVFGLYIAGLLNIGLFARTQQWQIREKPAGYVGSFLVGVTFAIGWTPCVGPILGAILSLAGTAETVQRGVWLLIAYSAGLGVPFLLTGLAINQFFSAFAKIRRHYRTIEIVSGALLVVIGVLIFTDRFTIIARWLTPYLPTF